MGEISDGVGGDDEVTACSLALYLVTIVMMILFRGNVIAKCSYVRVFVVISFNYT